MSMKTKVSTHSRPKTAGAPSFSFNIAIEFQLTAARRRLGAISLLLMCRRGGFQLTAARRRLGLEYLGIPG